MRFLNLIFLVAGLGVSMSACFQKSTPVHTGPLYADGNPKEQLKAALDQIDAGECGQAVEQIEQAAEAGVSWAYGTLAELYIKGTCVPKDMGNAYSYFEREASNGNCPVQLRLGEFDRLGIGTDKNPARAALRYRSGVLCFVDMPSEGREGFIKFYIQAKKIPAEIMKELKWLDSIDKSGRANKLKWAVRLMDGDRMPSFPDAAVSLALKTSNEGSVDAKYFLGIWTLTGKTTRHSKKDGEALLKDAALQGNVPAQVAVGHNYAALPPTLHRMSRAYLFLRLAELGGDQTVGAMLGKLEESLGPIYFQLAEEEAALEHRNIASENNR